MAMASVSGTSPTNIMWAASASSLECLLRLSRSASSSFGVVSGLGGLCGFDGGVLEHFRSGGLERGRHLWGDFKRANLYQSRGGTKLRGLYGRPLRCVAATVLLVAGEVTGSDLNGRVAPHIVGEDIAGGVDGFG